MRLLDRYLLRELAIPFCCCLSGFLIFWTAFNLSQDIDEFQDHHLQVKDVIEYYLVKVPEFLVVVLPVALLLALLYALTTHARHNEITAMRSAGISLWRLTRPYLVIGLLASGVLFLVNELLVPDSAERAANIKIRHDKNPINSSQRKRSINVGFDYSPAHRSWQIGYFDHKKTVLRTNIVIWKTPDGSSRWLYADEAIYTNDAWTFFGVKEYEDPPAANAFAVPLLVTNELTLSEFRETPEMMKDEIKINSRMTVMNAQEADIPITELLGYLHRHSNLSRTDRNWLYTKLQGRFAAPWTCLVVVLMAIPFGAASGRRNIFVGVASSVFLCFAYFVLLHFGMALGISGRLPPVLAGWLPNLAFGVTGIALTMRVR